MPGLCRRLIGSLPQRRVVAGLIAIAVIASPRAHAAGEPAEDFLKRLRAAGYFDTAIIYLDRLGDYPGVAAKIRDAVDLEKAQTFIDAALAARTVTEIDENFQRAEAALTTFLQQDSHPRIPQARLLLGKIQMRRGDQLMAGKLDEETRESAREAYNRAGETFDKIVETLRTQLTEMDGLRIDAQNNPERAAERDQYRAEFLEAMLKSGQARFLAAQTYADPAAGGKSLLEKALQQFTELNEKYRKYLTGAQAMLYRGKALAALGNTADALDSFLRTLEQPDADALRESKLEAVSGLISIWLAEDPPQYTPAIERGQSMLDSTRPNEKQLPSVQLLRLNLAKAYLYKRAAKDDHKPAEIKRATANARELLNDAKKFQGEHLEETRQLLADLGIETKVPDVAPTADPKSFDESLSTALKLYETVDSLEQSLKLIADQGDNEQQLAELNQQLRQAQASGIVVLRRGLGMINSETDSTSIDRARQILAYFLYQQQRFREASVVGGFMARHAPGTDTGLQGGLLALQSLQLLIAESSDQVGADLVPHVEQLGTYLATNWPDNPDAAAARGVMIRLALSKDRWDEARRLIDEMPAGPEQATFQRLMGQLTWNRSIRARRDGDDPQAETLLGSAIKDLQAGLNSISGNLVAPEARQAALVLAKANLRNNDSVAALDALDNATYGASGMPADDEPPSENFRTDLHSTELQVYVARMTDPGSDSVALLGRAEQAMKDLRESVNGDDAGTKLLGILIRLAGEIRSQIDAAPPAQRDKLVDAFRVFVERIAASTDDPATLQWVGNTLLEMGAGSMRGGQSKASGSAAKLLITSVKAFDDLKANTTDVSPAVRYQLGRAHRLLGDYKAAIDELETVLKQKPTMLDAQWEAALAYEQWAANINPKYAARAYESALMGARPSAPGQNTIWGWGKISQLTSRNEKFRDKFFDARYHVALSRYLMGKASSNDDTLERAIRDVIQVQQVYPDMGGTEQRQKFDLLLREIQKAAGKPVTGLP